MTDEKTPENTDEKSEKTPLPPLDLSGVELAVVGPEELGAHQRVRKSGGRTAAPRSKEQQAIDQLVKTAYDKWVRAGKPKEFAKSPGGRVKVPAAQQITVERAIRKAGVMHDLSIRFGANQPDAEGYVLVVFRASDKPVKTPESA